MTMKHVNLLVASLLIGACGGSSGGDAEPVNQAPSISAIPDQVATANAMSDPIPFTLMDEQIEALSLAVSSDRQEIVPDGDLAVTGTGSSRTLTATPVPDVLGDALITIVATDQNGLSASSAFLLTIDAEQRSLQQFVRDAFAETGDGEPVLINAIEFVQDADEDDFADVLAQ